MLSAAVSGAVDLSMYDLRFPQDQRRLAVALNFWEKQLFGRFSELDVSVRLVSVANIEDTFARGQAAEQLGRSITHVSHSLFPWLAAEESDKLMDIAERVRQDLGKPGDPAYEAEVASIRRIMAMTPDEKQAIRDRRAADRA